MPYYRRRGRGRGRGGRGRKSGPGFISRWGGYAYSGLKAVAMAANALKTANYVAGLINVEQKFCDTTLGVTSVTTTGAVSWLSSISEGSDYNNRDGLSIKAKSLYMRGNVAMAAGATDQTENIRCLLFIDKESGTAPTLGDVLENSSNYLSPLNHTNGKRFQILWDKVYSLSANGKETQAFVINQNLRQHIKWYNSTTGTKQGHVYFGYVSDGNTATTEPTLEFYSRIRYIDN